MDRVCFFSCSDLSTCSNLDLAEKRIKEIGNKEPNDIESIIELWHIRKFFDEECRLIRWSDEEYNSLKTATSGYSGIIARYFQHIEKNDVKSLYENLNWKYKASFWNIVDQFKCFKIIDDEILKEILENNINNLRYVLTNKKLVEKFKFVIKEVLLHEKNAAHILIDEFVGDSLFDSKKHYYIPDNLSIEDRENIILSYLNSETANLNYIRLIVQTKNIDGKFVLSPKTKYIAKKRAKKINEDLLNNPRTCFSNSQINIAFTNDKDGKILTFSKEKGCPSIQYRKQYIHSCSSIEKVFYFGQIFEWLDTNSMLTLINKNSEVEAFELLIKNNSKTAYPNYMAFELKNNLAIYQINGYCSTIYQKGNTLEQILESFYSDFLKDEFGYPGLKIRLPKPENKWIERCRIIFPELDNIARQYDTYIDEGNIDSEYLSMLKPKKLTETKSFLSNKYYEINEENTDISNILNLLFNKNVLLAHVDPYKDKHYLSFSNLMEHETVFYSNYEDFQKHKLDFLIEKNIIYVDSNDKIKYSKESVMPVFKSLWEFGCCSYWHYEEDVRKELDDMISKGWVNIDDHLFSKNERHYFSYYMDNSEFTNGYAYRNHYAHGSVPNVEDEVAHAVAYFTLLRLLIILLLKIYDDLYIARLVCCLNIDSPKK